MRERGSAWPALLAEHHRLLREAFGRYGGAEVGVEGDGFFVAFADPGGAVAGAVAAQHSLTALEGVRVRIGMHTGEPRLTEIGYVGVDVHRAARIAEAGHGGQVLLSEATHGLVPDGSGARSRRAPAQGPDTAAAAVPARGGGARAVVPAPAHAREPADKPAGAGDAADRT